MGHLQIAVTFEFVCDCDAAVWLVEEGDRRVQGVVACSVMNCLLLCKEKGIWISKFCQPHSRHYLWTQAHTVSYLVSWCFEPVQPQRIISGPKTNFSLSPSYSEHKSSNHKFYIYKISPDAFFLKKQNIHTQAANTRVSKN